MQVLDELICGTIPSHPLYLNLKAELAGVIFDIQNLRYRGQHARRLLFVQQGSHSHVIVRRNHNQFVCVVSVDHWRQRTVFTILQANVYIDVPS